MHFDSAGVSLAGAFVDPGGASAGALILTGSGRVDRDSNGPRFRGQINPAIAHALAVRGVASLRYDKRGAGKSGGDFFRAGMSENYADACAAIDWLASRAPARPIYAIGHSEGALHVAHLAADGKVAGVVLIDPLKSQRKALDRIRSTSADSLRIQGKKVNARWLREFIDYDPAPILEGIHVPVLVLVPEHDMQVPPEDGDVISTLVAGPCKEVTVPGLSHILRDDRDSKGPRGYLKALKAPVNPVVLDTITAWIEEQLHQPSQTGPAEARQ